MSSNQEIVELAKITLQIESESISDLISSLDDQFAEAIQLMHQSKGRIVITGIGKSANIANKIVATLNSTGSPAIFMHAADAIHGDLGNIQKDDVVICISNSGNTPEIKVLVPFIKNMGNKLVAFVGSRDSFLADAADFVLYTGVKKEACPNNLAPTSSTTAQLAMGDAVAVCLLKLNKFGESDFAKYHPGGALGKKLYLKVSDLLPQHELPQVAINSSVPEVILEISSKRLGATSVLDNGNLVGIITDGDLRRMLEKHKNIETLIAGDIMSKNPKTINHNAMAIEAYELMQQNNITQLMVLEDDNLVGVIHLHDLLREGIY